MLRLKQIFPFIFLIVFGVAVFNYVTFVAINKVQKGSFRQELLATSLSLTQKKVLPAEDLYKNKNGWEWHEHNKEVSINGQFYEVIKVIKEDDTVIVCLVKDTKENALFANYFTGQKKNNDLIHSIVKLLFGLDECKNLTPDFTGYASVKSISVPAGEAKFTQGHAYDIIKPPRFLFL